MLLILVGASSISGSTPFSGIRCGLRRGDDHDEDGRDDD
jgi:hypothetical protein